jgi:hypothetical protein
VYDGRDFESSTCVSKALISFQRLNTASSSLGKSMLILAEEELRSRSIVALTTPILQVFYRIYAVDWEFQKGYSIFAKDMVWVL